MPKIVATRDTVVKTSTAQSNQLPPADKVTLKAGDFIDVTWVEKSGTHLKFERKDPLNGKYVWYAYSPDVTVQSDDMVKTFTPEINAFLDLIAYCEGTDRTIGNGVREGYDILFGGDKFSGFADHPRKLVVKGGYRSTAAGRYQFLSQTWDECKQALNLVDFSPMSQDRAAVFLLQRRKAYQDIIDGNLENALDKTSWEWASLPYDENKSRYGQPIHPLSKCREIYQQALKNYLPIQATNLERIFELGDYLPPSVNLPIPYLSQRDNALYPSTTCNTTCVAMCLKYLGIEQKGDRKQFEDELTERTLKWGAEGRYWHENLVKLFGEYGVKDRFSTKTTWAELKTHLANKKPAIYAGKFTNGGHLIVIRGYDGAGYFVNDPWGEWFSSGYQAKSGENLHYSTQLITRVSYGGNNAGWIHLVG